MYDPIAPADLLAALLVIAGVAGIVLPVLPGTPLIFAAALLFDYTRDWQALGWGWLLVLLILTLASEIGDWWLGTLGARKGGASGRALLIGLLIGIVGQFIIPIPGVGFILGSIVGIVGTEWLRLRNTKHALKAGSGWLIGWLASLIMQGVVALLMVAIIVWRLA